ncbi:hypothetical protein TSUD_241540 [Trifolium subterraneum]|uniref:Heparanase-like protein 2 n=1 Tax=Trifolium subterraneum TaxID=3900 RepID=A0A2Z6PKB3_TRISU|nr:hypothetical protein TSUD_241540 [Trifolium subterraneum]
MDLKVTLCYILLLLFSISSAEDVKLKVKGVTNIATTDENFICTTLDWWPENKCDYNQCPWGKTGILNLDLDNKILSNAIKAFDPLRIRLGGSLQDQIIYQFGLQKDCTQIIKKDDGLFGFSVGCLPQHRWDRKNSKKDKLNYLGDWNPLNAIGLMKYTISKGYKIDSYELGNELCSEGVSARIDSVQYAKDITKLRFIINKLYPNVTTRPKVLGPAGFYGKEWFDSFLQNIGPGVVDGVTHHIYNLGAGVDKDLIHKVQDPYFLSQIAQTFKDVSVAVKEFTPWAGAWVGESGGAYNSGGKDVSHTFVNGFWYLDQLGMTSTFNHKVYCRQALIGGNYALLNTTTFIPNPDYYGALLWHRLMGSNVLSVSHEGSPYLRTYAHCSKKGPGITVLIINMSKSTFNFSLVNDMNLYPEDYTTEGSIQTSTSNTMDKQMREEYHLTPKDGNIQSDVVLLNGTPLKLTESLDIPELKPVLVSSSSPIKVGPQSIVFVNVKDFKAPACAASS